MKKSTTLEVVNFAGDYGKHIVKITHKTWVDKAVCFYANNKQIAPLPEFLRIRKVLL